MFHCHAPDPETGTGQGAGFGSFGIGHGSQGAAWTGMREARTCGFARLRVDQPSTAPFWRFQRIEAQNEMPISVAPPNPVMTSGIWTCDWQNMITDSAMMA